MAEKQYDFTKKTVNELVERIFIIGRNWMAYYHWEIEEYQKEMNAIEKELEKRIKKEDIK